MNELYYILPVAGTVLFAVGGFLGRLVVRDMRDALIGGFTDRLDSIEAKMDLAAVKMEPVAADVAYLKNNGYEVRTRLNTFDRAILSLRDHVDSLERSYKEDHE